MASGRLIGMLCAGKMPTGKIVPINANTFSEYFLDARRKCGLEHLVFHDSRHTAATNLSTKLANAYIRAGLAGNLAEGLQLATSSKDASPDKVRADIFGKALVAKGGNATAAQKATEEAMAYLLPGGSKPSRSASGKVSNALPEFKDQGEADAAVKAGKLKPGDRVSIGGRAATWQ